MDKNISVKILKGNILTMNNVVYSNDVIKDIADQLEEAYPGCIEYDEEKQEIIYSGPISNFPLKVKR